MKNLISQVLVLTLLLNAGCVLKGAHGERSIASGESLFSSDESFKFNLKADFKDLFSYRLKSKDFPQGARVPASLPADYSVDGIFTYETSSKEQKELSVKVSLRGNTSQLVEECPFPKLELKFKESEIAGTILEGNRKLDIGSHCNNKGGFSTKYKRLWNGKSPHREVMAYRILEIMGMTTRLARKAFATYIESTTGEVLAQNAQAIFLEDMAIFIKRLNVKEIREHYKLKPPGEKKDNNLSNHRFESLDTAPLISVEDLTRVYFYQALINNHDWEIREVKEEGDKGLWNVKLLEISDTKWVVVPNDFDLAGIVNSYGGEKLALETAAKIDINIRKQVAQEFLQHKKELYALLKEFEDDRDGAKLFKKHLDWFYKGNLRTLTR